MSSTTGPDVGRLEVFSMGFNIRDSNSNIEDYRFRDPRSSNEDSDLADLKKQARIFFLADDQFIELYNSKVADSLYSDVPIHQELKISDFTNFDEEEEEMPPVADCPIGPPKSPGDSTFQGEMPVADFFQKRMMGDSFSGRTDVSEASPKRAKKIHAINEMLDGLQKSPVDSTFRGTDLMLTGPNEEEEEEEEEEDPFPDGFPYNSNYALDLPLTGPNDEMLVDDLFCIVIHEHTGNPSEDDDYEKLAAPFYTKGHGVAWGDSVFGWMEMSPSSYDEPAFFDCTIYEYRTLRLAFLMEYIVYRDSKAVDVYVLWCMPDSNVCGKIAVSNDKFADKESILIQTPQNKAIHAEKDKLLKLSKFTVALPYDSGFTVKVRLHDPKNNDLLLVDDSVYFPFRSFYKPVYTEDPNDYLYRDEKTTIEGIIKVRVTVYV